MVMHISVFQTCTHYVTIGFKVQYVGKEIIYRWMKNQLQSDMTHIFRKDGFFFAKLFLVF